MNALNPPILVYEGRKDGGADHVKAIIEGLRWQWEHCHFEHIRDWEDHKAEQDALEDERRYYEQMEAEREAQEAEDARMDKLNRLGIAPAPWN